MSNESGATQCPKCGAVGTYPITMRNFMTYWLFGGALMYSILRRHSGLLCVPLSLALYFTGDSAAFADPTVPGFRVTTFAVTDRPTQLSFDRQGNLFVGRDDKSTGSGARATFIFRISPDGSVIEYGDSPIGDPDAVLVDRDGLISGVAGSVLVGGQIDGGGPGKITAILPDQSVVTIFGPTNVFQNPDDLVFDSTGRMLFTAGRANKIFATSGGFPTALFDVPSEPHTIVVDSDDHIYTTSIDGVLRIHDADGNLLDNSFATNLGQFAAIGFGHGPFFSNDLYVIANERLLRFYPNGTFDVIGTGFAEDREGVRDLMFGPDGALYVTEIGNNRILRIGPIDAPIDVKPNSNPNSINLKSKGVIAVAILTTGDFDALDVDVSSVDIGDPVLIDDGGLPAIPIRSAEKDIDGDGDIDLVMHFSIVDMVEGGAIDRDSLGLLLIGKTMDGVFLEGMDFVSIVK